MSNHVYRIMYIELHESYMIIDYYFYLKLTMYDQEFVIEIIRADMGYHNRCCIFDHVYFSVERTFQNQRDEFEFEDLCKLMWDHYRDPNFGMHGRSIAVICLMVYDLIMIESEYSRNKFMSNVPQLTLNAFDERHISDYKLIAEAVDVACDVAMMNEIINMFYRSKSIRNQTSDVKCDINIYNALCQIIRNNWNYITANDYW